MDQIIIQQHISQHDFFKLNLYLTFKKWSIRFILGVFGFIFIWSLAGFLLDRGSSAGGLYMGIPIILVILSTYLRSRTVYRSNAGIRDIITYQFTPELVTLRSGNSVSEFNWEAFYKITETQKYILLWIHKAGAHFIKKDEMNEAELEKLKEFARKHEGLKVKLS